jgi:NAD(P)H-flavin reductase/fatty-acid desaturase
MANAAAPKRLSIVQINDRRLSVEPKETVLTAALRAGIPFPYSCGVGGCGTCKCKLTEGKVRELTETGYLLTAEELDQGYILACQSVPQGDLRIEIDLERASIRGAAGRVVEQRRLTHDITQLVVQLDASLAYRAGQFANLSLAGLPGVSRSYSFASPPSDDGRVEFFVRQVPGGAFSTFVAETDLVGHDARVEGPHGDFWLRPSEAPLVCVAGGSGLAPVLALLEEALASGVDRPVTLFFGAREQRDLYGFERIHALEAAWSSDFRFVPVLSAEPAESTWTGARGLVTEHLASALEPGAHAYLCGPPGLIDAALPLFAKAGVSRENVHFDRFTTRADVGATPAMEPAPTAPSAGETSTLVNVLHYLKFFSFHLVGLFAGATLLAGGAYVTAGLVGVLTLYMLGDALLGDDVSTPTFTRSWILTAQLWLALPLLALLVFGSVWSMSAGDPLGFGAALERLVGYDFLAARAATSPAHHASAFVLTGLMIGMVGTIPAHELTHRTWDPVSMFVGRWLLAFSFDTSFAIEHVYGHHRYVSTVDDPATAPRGRNVYAHVVASTIAGNRSAWHIEVARLAKRRRGVFSVHNAFLRGHLMSVALVALAYGLGGGRAALFFVACALWGKALLEIVNYMEHYGLVRDPATPVQPRHSWNTNRRMSSWALFNLTRHSHHHAQGEVPYQDLKPYPRAPMMINGYITTIVLAMIPPLWHALMTPKVLAWDRDFATDDERRLAAAANGHSGKSAFSRANEAAAGAAE